MDIPTVKNHIYPFYQNHCFSNWYPSKFIINGNKYYNGEQWMMAVKARLFEDEATLYEIMKATSPSKAKSLGRLVKNFDPKLWDQNKMELVYTGLLEKFIQNPEMKAILLSTHGNLIVEASPIDRIWGVGIDKDNPNIYNKEKWKGDNCLGEVLMSIRNTLR